jgi:hypothetical protein
VNITVTGGNVSVNGKVAVHDTPPKGMSVMAIKEALLKSGQVTADRIFMIEPKSLAPERKPDLKDSRVDFRLRQDLLQGPTLRGP